jgi:hypothetical protein
MDGLWIFLVVMACANDVLICDDLSERTAYRDMDACQAARAATLEQDNWHLAARSRLFARCQYVLIDPPSVKDASAIAGSPASRLAW